MAVGTSEWPNLPAIAGLKIGVAEAGIKYANRMDLGVFILEKNAKVAGVFTQNRFAAAPVDVCRQHLLYSTAMRALIVNSGNANACTGELGKASALRSCQCLAQQIGIAPEQVLPFSTGVIGEDLPIDKIESALPKAISSADENSWFDFAKCIMTTDTRPKGAARTLELNGETVTINGVAKGSGMINPNMATMLAYVATDAKLSDSLIRSLSKSAANASFNRVTIDGDTSTNDSCVLIATGKSTEFIDEKSAGYPEFYAALVEVYQDLAKQVVMDGEGATKFVEVEVINGSTKQECLDVAYAIAHSPLVKTALFASDPNWGRIVCAIGYAGIEDLDVSKITVSLDDVLIVEDGGRAKTYSETLGQAVFNQDVFTIRVDLARGPVCEKLWTTDLSHEYIRINAEYRS